MTCGIANHNCIVKTASIGQPAAKYPIRIKAQRPTVNKRSQKMCNKYYEK